jgi:hypothetical protein
VDNNERILFWNSAAQDLFGLAAGSVIGLHLSQLPIDNGLLKALVRRHAMVVEKLKPTSIKDQPFKGGRFGDSFDVHFTPVSRTGTPQSVLIMFGPLRRVESSAKRIGSNNSGKSSGTRSARMKTKSSPNGNPSKKTTRPNTGSTAKTKRRSGTSASARRKR